VAGSTTESVGASTAEISGVFAIFLHGGLDWSTNNLLLDS
jgi:hypothetical protein